MNGVDEVADEGVDVAVAVAVAGVGAFGIADVVGDVAADVGDGPSHSLSCRQASFVSLSVVGLSLGQRLLQMKNLAASVEDATAPWNVSNLDHIWL